MRAATISEIKSALHMLTQKEIADIMVRMATFKKENKELLTYLLYEADDQTLFIKHVKEEMDEQFSLMNKSNVFFAKKTIRKVLRTTHKYIRFAGLKQVEAELLIYFCKMLKESGFAYEKYPVVKNIYTRQKEKIQKALSTLHEDLQYDYGLELDEL